jgi:hypothetical protein
MPTVLVAIWLVGAVVTWNVIFDAGIVRGARDYVDRQQLFVDGRGPRQDMEQVMTAARSSAIRSATAWTVAELLPGLGLWAFARLRRGRAHTAQ